MKNNSCGLQWPDAVWTGIDEQIVSQAKKTRTLQKMIPTTVYDHDPGTVQDDVISFPDFSVGEGTRTFIEALHTFTLTNTQIDREAELHTAELLGRMVAARVAIVEDSVLLRGHGAPSNGVTIAFNEPPNGPRVVGLVDEAGETGDTSDTDPDKVSVPIEITPLDHPRPGVLFGEKTFFAVADGIAKLTAKGQSSPFGLVLGIEPYADLFATPGDGSLVTTAERVRPLVERGLYGTPSMPNNRGLLIAFGGEPTSIFMGHEARSECVRQEGRNYIFQVIERFQHISRDPRAFVLLKFERPIHQETRKAESRR